MPLKKPGKGEREYILREEQKDIVKKKAQSRREAELRAREELQALHYMKCPKCGADLGTELFQGLEIDRCGECRGVWLDIEDLHKLAGKESKILQDIFDFFKQVGEATPISDM